MTIHKVYWTESGKIYSDSFSEIDKALKCCESLRKFQKEGIDISFITIASENPNCTSLQGIEVVGDDYDWKKRRNNRPPARK